MPEDGRMQAAEADIDAIQEAIGGIREDVGEMRRGQEDLGRRFGRVEEAVATSTAQYGQSLAAHEERLRTLEREQKAARDERAQQAAASRAVRWQWIGWFITGAIGLGEIIAGWARGGGPKL